MSDYAWNEYDPCRKPREPRVTELFHIKVYCHERVLEFDLGREEALWLLKDLDDILDGGEE